MKLSKLKKFPTLQSDESDCGVACLSAVIIHFGGFVGLEKLRDLSGTSKLGTTLLGLSEAAAFIGIKGSGIKTNTEYLKSIINPCILHVILENKLSHFLVCYGFENGRYIIGDPAIGMRYYTESELNAIWKTNILLTLECTDDFVPIDNYIKSKRAWLKNIISIDISILLVITFLGLVISFSGLVISVFSQQLIDNIIPNSNFVKLSIGLALVTFILLVRSVINYLRNKLLNIQSKYFNTRLINYFYSSLLRLPKRFFDNRKVGELVSRMEDTSRLQTVLAFIFGELIKDILLVSTSVAILFYYSFFVGMLVLMFIPFYFIITKYFHKPIIYHQYEVMSANAEKTNFYINTLSGIDTVKNHNKEFLYALKNKHIYGKFQEKIFLLNTIGVKFQLAAEVLSVLLIMAVLSQSSILVLSNNLKLGELMAITSITSIMLPAIVNIAYANTRIQGARVAFERMHDFTGLEPEYQNDIEINMSTKDYDYTPFVFESLEFKVVSFRFPGRKNLLNNISFILYSGEIITLHGESGSGKTSILNLLLRFYEPTSGEIFINNIPSRATPVYLWRNIYGVVPQEPKIFNGFLLENICLSSLAEDLLLTQNFCIDYGFDKYFEKLPMGLNTLLGDDGVNISGGQKQLISLARAIYKKPKVLFLDEPTSSMDKNLEIFVNNLLLKLKSQMTIFVITHRNTMDNISDRILFLKEGHIYANKIKEDLDY